MIVYKTKKDEPHLELKDIANHRKAPVHICMCFANMSQRARTLAFVLDVVKVQDYNEEATHESLDSHDSASA
jgi:hypothetical protein